MDLTLAELLFGAAAGEPDSSIAVAEPDEELSHVGPATPDLLRVLSGAPWPALTLEYAPKTDTRPCPHCLKSIDAEIGGVGSAAALGIHDNLSAEVDRFRWYHPLCAVEANGEQVTRMSGYMITRDLPDCRMCGKSWEEHYRPITNIWAAYCDTDGLPDVVQYYRPSTPWQARDWPFDMVVDSPMYTPDGRIAYANTEAALGRIANDRARRVAMGLESDRKRLIERGGFTQ